MRARRSTASYKGRSNPALAPDHSVSAVDGDHMGFTHPLRQPVSHQAGGVGFERVHQVHIREVASGGYASSS